MLRFFTARPGHDDAPVPGSVRVLEPPVLVDAPEEEPGVQQDEQQREEDELEVVPHVGDGQLVRHPAQQHLLQGGGGAPVAPAPPPLGLRGHQPPVDGDGQVLQEAVVLGQLGLQGLERDARGEGLKVGKTGWAWLLANPDFTPG